MTPNKLSTMRRGRRFLSGFAILAVAVGAVAISWLAEPNATSARGLPADHARGAAQPQLLPALVARDLAPDAAERVNSTIPVIRDSNAIARPFAVGGSATAYDRALDCLTSAVYYEAASESTDGQRAVAQVVLNRVRNPAFASSVCGVVYQGSTQPGCQFTFACDGSLNRTPMRAYWDRARKVAQEALSGAVFAPVGLATHYHANYVVPVWATSLVKNAAIGAHYFYHLKGSWGQPAAFSRAYSGMEPDEGALRRAALVALASRQAAGAVASNGADQTVIAQQLVQADLQVQLAAQTLGARNPKMIELQKQRAALARRAPLSSSAQLAAINAEIKTASKTLGPKHPQMIALLQRRAALSGSARN